jgi:hypothetical protein
VNKWFALAVLPLFLLPAFAGCTPAGDAKAPVPATTPVTIDEWCSSVTAKLCERTAETCHKGSMDFANGCKDKGTATCNAGREPSTPSGRTHGELEQCLAKLAPLSCEELQGMAANTDLVAACSAGAPQSGNTPPAATATATAEPAATAPAATATPAATSPSP